MYTQNEFILKISFETVFEYLHLLRMICEVLSKYNREASVFLAAAVSDFYIPESALVCVYAFVCVVPLIYSITSYVTDNKPEHKIQSNEALPPLVLSEVPKMLGLIRDRWAPQSFIVSFKVCICMYVCVCVCGSFTIEDMCVFVYSYAGLCWHCCFKSVHRLHCVRRRHRKGITVCEHYKIIFTKHLTSPTSLVSICVSMCVCGWVSFISVNMRYSDGPNLKSLDA